MEEFEPNVAVAIAAELIVVFLFWGPTASERWYSREHAVPPTWEPSVSQGF